MVGMAVATTVDSMEARNRLSMMPMVTRMIRLRDIKTSDIANFFEWKKDLPRFILRGYLVAHSESLSPLIVGLWAVIISASVSIDRFGHCVLFVENNQELISFYFLLLLFL